MVMNPYYYPSSYPQYTNQTQQNTQMQANGLISVRSEREAGEYPIAPGNSITFKDETAPYIYTKTMGFSQLDRPVFEKYRLVKEEAEPIKECVPVDDDFKTRLESLEIRISKIEEDIKEGA